MTVIVHGVSWNNGEVCITFTPETSVKDVAGMPVIKMHQLVLPGNHPSFSSDMREINEALQDLVRDATTAWEEAEQYDPSMYDDDDDDEDDDDAR